MVLPLIIMFIAAILEFGRAWNIKQAITDAAREGARYTVVKDNTITTVAQIQDKVEQRLALASIEESVVTVWSADPFCSPLSNCFHRADGAGWGREMTVSVSTQHRMGLVHMLLGWAGVPSTVTIATDATMRNE